MSESTETRQQRESAGYSLVTGAAVLFASGLLLVVSFDRSLVLFGSFALVAVVLAVLGSRSVSAARAGTETGAARFDRAVEYAGTVAFWVLLSVLLVDAAAAIVPARLVPAAYAYVGGLAFLLAYAYESIAR